MLNSYTGEKYSQMQTDENFVEVVISIRLHIYDLLYYVIT